MFVLLEGPSISATLTCGQQTLVGSSVCCCGRGFTVAAALTLRCQSTVLAPGPWRCTPASVQYVGLNGTLFEKEFKVKKA